MEILVKEEYNVKVFSDRTEWYQNNRLHRVGKPAIEYNNGEKHYYRYGQLHNSEGPAVIQNTGHKHWFIEGIQYTENDFNKFKEAKYNVKVFIDRTEWHQAGKLHRDGGPAIEYNDGTKKWYKYGKVHRDDGPAIIYGDRCERWYIKGYEYTKDGYHKVISKLKNKKDK